ncbi:MAG TPA: RICIN domain-containing protein [Blastocatellia bacterium]|nr:RICIN domain-containing protein [Blastocatellia bacterium]
MNIKRVPQQSRKLASLPTVRSGESVEGFETVKEFLERFGYMDAGAVARRSIVLDEPTSTAIVKYQAMHGLPLSGVFDEATREMMSRSRCALPDINPASGVAFSATCAWTTDNLTYAFGAGTNDVAGDDERQAIRRAFATWSAAVQISFREVGTGDNPNIMIAWTQANCGDANMAGGVLAHADYPPGCGFFGNALPRPLHFDDQEHAWCIGAVANQFDVETIALHEIGHLLGLAHSSVAGAVMFPTVSANSTNRVLSPDDHEGILHLYPIRGPVFARHSGRCLDIEGISTVNGADAIQWDYWGGKNQIFRIEWVEGPHYRLIAQHSGRIIDVEGISATNGAQIQQWDWLGGENQKFRLEPVGHGYSRLVAKHSGKCLDVSGISGDNGAKVIQWDWWGGNNQQWRLSPAPIVSRHSGKSLDVEAISVENGAKLIQWDYWGGGNQRFRLDPVDDGYYRIMIEHSGKCLDVSGISSENGAPIIQWEYWGGDNQKFRIEATGDGYYKIIAKHSGKCLDVSGISSDNGAAIIQWDWWGGTNQQWRL